MKFYEKPTDRSSILFFFTYTCPVDYCIDKKELLIICGGSYENERIIFVYLMITTDVMNIFSWPLLLFLETLLPLKAALASILTCKNSESLKKHRVPERQILVILWHNDDKAI